MVIKKYLPKDLKELAKTVFYSSGGTTLSLAFAAIGGIFLVRFLSPDNYARYALVYGVYQTLQLLGDSGTANAVSNEARKNWKSKDHIASALEAGRIVRRPIATTVYCISFPVTIYLCMKHGATSWSAVVMSLFVITSCLLTNKSSFASIPLYLHQRIATIQKAQVAGDLCRIILVFTLIYFLPNDLVAVGVFLMGLYIRNRILIHESSDLIGVASNVPEQSLMESISKFVIQIRPVWIYACFSGTITIFIASIFSDTQALAAVGGLGRITALMSVGGFLFSAVVAPRFARELNKDKLMQNFKVCVISLLCISIGSGLPIILFPELALLVIGQEYAEYRTELIICTIGSIAYMVYAGLYGLSIGRGNLVKPWLFLAVVIVWQIILFASLDVRTLYGVVTLGALTPLPGVVFYFISSYRGIKTEQLAS